jgi:CheY-like chemotaxis protein
MIADATVNILVVEDDENIRFTVELLLQTEGYHVAAANNGQEALTYLETHPQPSLILLDMTMPVMDGWTFANHLHSQYGHSIPVLVMTAASNAEQRAKDIQAEGWVSKPFSIENLLSAVKTHVLH